MEFIISGIHFPISEEMKNYRYYRKLFSDLADQVASEFDALYTKQNHRWRILFKTVPINTRSACTQ